MRAPADAARPGAAGSGERLEGEEENERATTAGRHTEEVAVASEPQPTARARRPTLSITEAGRRRAVLAFSGRLDAGALGELEERLVDPRLLDAQEVVLEMGDLDHIDLACAYALIRAATGRPQSAALTVRGADRTVRRTLHAVGLDVVAVIEE
ncbi:hypothetical protein SUDANB106_05568 [Streptomyces sp. enrichment culture]